MVVSFSTITRPPASTLFPYTTLFRSRDAWLAHSPVLAFTGGRDPKTKFRKVYQEIDDVPAFEPVTKWNATVDVVERFPDMLRQAFRVATSGAPGPVHLQFRGNEGQLDQEEAEMEPLVEPQFARVPAFRPRPDLDDLKKAAQYLERAERPVIIAGGGVRWSGAGPELVALAEALSIPVATSLNGKDCIAASHPLALGVVGSYSRESANRGVAAPVRPERICAELSRHVPGDAIVLADTGHAGMWMGGMYDLRGGQSFLRSAGHLGWAFPAGLGAKCAAPGRPVVTFTGDAGLWY